MANIKSQIKRNRQNEKRRQRNRAVRSEINTRTRAAAEGGSAADTAEAARTAIKRIDKAAAKGVLHPNNAARKKSRLMKRLARLQAE